MKPNIIVKKNLVIFRNPEEWQNILDQLYLEYGLKIGISWVMLRELGFTVRSHRGLVPNEHVKPGRPVMHYEQQVHLDFFNESTQSWFVLRYLNLSNNSQDLT
jgi:hypothetical protein